jgi:anti-anti-sigma factor
METGSEVVRPRHRRDALRPVAAQRPAQASSPAIQVGHAGGLWLVKLEHSRLTVATAAAVVAKVAELIPRGARRIVVDLGSVRDIDCAGVGALAEIHRLVAGHGGRAVFARAAPLVRRLIETSRLDRVIGLVPSGGIADAASPC